jgi:hypothetical protein
MAERPRVRSGWRSWVRAIHRDAGCLAVGLTIVYALSGLAVNHIADWDPSFVSYARVHELGPLDASDAAVAQRVLSALGVDAAPREVYRASPTRLEIGLDKRTIHVDTASGRVVDEGQRPRFFLRAANWLHLNRGKKAWRWFADGYAVGLLLLAGTGIFMLPGRRGLALRGAILIAAGVALPTVYLALAGPL